MPHIIYSLNLVINNQTKEKDKKRQSRFDEEKTTRKTLSENVLEPKKI